MVTLATAKSTARAITGNRKFCINTIAAATPRKASSKMQQQQQKQQQQPQKDRNPNMTSIKSVGQIDAGVLKKNVTGRNKKHAKMAQTQWRRTKPH